MIHVAAETLFTFSDDLLRRVSPRRREAATRPIGERLILRTAVGGDYAELDGERFSLSGENDLQFLSHLLEQDGAPLKAQTIEDSLRERPSRIYDRLPKQIQKIIHKPGSGFKTGYYFQ